MAATSTLPPAPIGTPIMDVRAGVLTSPWAVWFALVRDQAIPDSGTTALRPTAVYVGQMYFDTTLGYPVWCSNVSTQTWVDAQGNSV